MILTFATNFAVFLAVLGPPKVLLAFAGLTVDRTPKQAHRLILLSSLLAAVVGVVLAYTATPVTDFFHISAASLLLSGGVIFFVYAVLTVLGIHLTARPRDEDSKLSHGIRQLLLPYAASPLAVTSVLITSLADPSWYGRWITASSYVAVVGINAVCAYLLAPIMRRTSNPDLALEVLSRLLGLLLAAVGVQLVLEGLAAVGVTGLLGVGKYR